MMRWCADSQNEDRHGKILFNTYLVLFFTSILINFIFIPLRPFLSNLFFGSEEYQHFFTIMIGTVSLEMLNQAPMNFLRFQEKPIHYSAIFVTKLLIILGLNIFFLVYVDTGIIGIFYSQLIANIMILFITLPILLKNFKYKFDLILISEMLKYGIPLIFSAISVQLLAISDRFIIKDLLDFSQVGIYSLGAKIAGVLNVFVVQAFALGFLPIAYKMLHSPDAKLFYQKIFKFLVLALVFFALGLSLFAHEVLLLFAKKPEFIVAYKIVPLLTVTFIFKGIQYMFMLGFHYVKKTKYIAYIVTFVLVINICLNYLLIPKWGIWGAAFATVTSGVLICLISYIVSQRFFPVNYELNKMFTAFGVGAFLFSISFMLPITNLIFIILLKLILLLFFPILLYLFHFFEKTELEKIKKYGSFIFSPK